MRTPVASGTLDLSGKTREPLIHYGTVGNHRRSWQVLVQHLQESLYRDYGTRTFKTGGDDFNRVGRGYQVRTAYC